MVGEHRSFDAAVVCIIRLMQNVSVLLTKKCISLCKLLPLYFALHHLVEGWVKMNFKNSYRIQKVIVLMNNVFKKNYDVQI